MRPQRLAAAATAGLMFAGAVMPALAAPRRIASRSAQTVIAQGRISGNRTVSISQKGIATITSADHRTVEVRHVPFDTAGLRFGPGGKPDAATSKSLIRSVDTPKYRPYVPGVVNVVFRDGTTSYQDVAQFSVVKSSSIPSYSNDARVNAAFAKMGVDHIARIGRSMSRSTLSTLRSRAQASNRSVLNLANAFQIHLTGMPVPQAVHELRKLGSIAYASPDWIVSTTNVPGRALPKNLQMPSARTAFSKQWARFTSSAVPGRSNLPGNYGISTSLQSFMNAPGVDAVAAYDEIAKKFGQLPGQGELITNVSLGDVCTNPLYGNPSSHVINGQHYLDVPSMPLIPEYVVDTDGNLSGSAEACGIDPGLGEVLLDFSVMAPLPDGAQRAGETGTGVSDLLGIAPGAQYRLVVPQGVASTSALAATFLAAASQSPAPQVITASIGWGLDAQGFPSRYLEEDPLMQSVISSIVNANNIVVCISAGDGLRIFTNASVNTMGGSVPTNLAQSADQQTNLNDVAGSTVASSVVDTGAIDVGGTTTDDVFSANPLDPANAQYVNQLAFPEVRWDGFQSFSSGFGTRVNVSAPSDNIPAMSLSGAGYDQVYVGLNGGTSASAPMVAAAAAVMLQVARLTGHPFAKATDVRAHLISTAVPVPNVPQADSQINVGPQINVRRGVEKLLADSGASIAPSVGRVAVAQRRLFLGGSYCTGGPDSFEADAAGNFVEATDPAFIRLDDSDDCQQPANRNLNSPITMSPDWEAMPSNVRYKLYVTGHADQVLSQTPWARVYPKQIFSAAGLALSSSTPRTISLTYEADAGLHMVASTTFDLTFGPAPAQSYTAPAPIVAPVIDSSKVKPCMSYAGNCFTVAYDLTGVPASRLNNPVIEVSNPGRPTPASGPIYNPIWTSQVLTQLSGNVEVPVNALGGGGMYGVVVNLAPDPMAFSFIGINSYSLPAITRLVAGSSARPAAPLVSLPGDAAAGIPPSHGVTVPFGGSFNVAYDVSNVPGATNAMLEISAPGPNFYNNFNTFNNPDGSVTDNNGRDTGSVAMIPLPSTRGTITLTDAQAHLVRGMSHVIRVIPEQGTTGVGEASDVSSVQELAIATPDGNPLINGYAINPNGDDGVYTTAGPLLTWNTTGSLIGTFSQSTGAETVTGITYIGDPYSLIGGYVGGDNIVFQQGAISAANSQYSALVGYLEQVRGAALQTTTVTPPANWMYLPTFNPAVPTGYSIVEAGQNSSTQTSAILYGQPMPGGATNYGVVAANIGTQTASAFIPLNVPGFGVNFGANIDYDPVSNTGYVLISQGSPFGFGADSAVLATVNFTAGTVSYRNLGALGYAYDFEIDPATHTGVMTSTGPNGFFAQATLTFIDLSTATVKKSMAVPTSSNIGAIGLLTKIGIDPAHQLVAVQNYLPVQDDTDNNPLSQVDFYDESGTYVTSTPRSYNLFTFTYGDHWFQLNPTTRTGFMSGPDLTQIVPFNY